MEDRILQQECMFVADFSDVTEPTTIPVRVELLGDPVSNLNPEPGELQRFCYRLTQTAGQYDLSHWVLGICPELTLEDIASVSVTINGVDQNAQLGTDVTIGTDSSTGLVGLKFDYGLDFDEDITVMIACFELNVARVIEAITVYVTGGPNPIPGQTGPGVLASTICGPGCNILPPPPEEGCIANINKIADITVPITVTPIVDVMDEDVEVMCCGNACISTTPPTGGQPSCTFYVTQSVCITVPVSFDADVTANDEDAIVNCDSDAECEGCVENPCPSDGE